MTTPLSAFDAGTRAYALIREANNLSDGHRSLLLLWLAEHYPFAFRGALDLIGDLNPPADWPVTG